MAFDEYIESVCRSVGTPFFALIESAVLGFRLNSNILNISFTMGMFSYSNWLKCSVGTLIFDVFSMYFDDKMISQWEHHIPAITCDEGIQCHWTRI